MMDQDYNGMKIAVITNLCPTYRVKAFQQLAKLHPVDFYFYSKQDGSAVSHLETVGNVQGFRYMSTVKILIRLLSEDYRTLWGLCGESVQRTRAKDSLVTGLVKKEQYS